MGLVCGYYCGTAILWRYRGTAVVPANQAHIYRKSMLCISILYSDRVCRCVLPGSDRVCYQVQSVLPGLEFDTRFRMCHQVQSVLPGSGCSTRFRLCNQVQGGQPGSWCATRFMVCNQVHGVQPGSEVCNYVQGVLPGSGMTIPS